jgi:hypothetical protein
LHAQAKRKIADVSIYDLTARQLFNLNNPETNSNKLEIKSETLSSGVCFVKVKMKEFLPGELLLIDKAEKKNT